MTGGSLVAQRYQPRLEQIKTCEADMADTLAYLGKFPKFNARPRCDW